ncbi:MAG: hypothetical protein HKN87_13310 [Saprospiraceae bacterium]|nr:hypothetical protein [Saprospiraceae bacterium]
MTRLIISFITSISIAISIQSLSHGQLTPQTDIAEPGVPERHQEEYLLQDGSVMGFHFIKQKPHFDVDRNRVFLSERYFPTWRDLLPDSRVYHLRGERGANVDSQVFCWIFRDLETRNQYWPHPDRPSEKYLIERRKIDWLYQDSTFYLDNEGWVDSLSNDYLVVACGKPVRNIWLTKGAVVGMHQMILKKDVQKEDFEQFIINVWSPNRSDALPGAKVFFLKGIRGPHQDVYFFLMVLQSMQVRDRYFPSLGGYSQDFLDHRANWEWLYSSDQLGQYLEQFADEHSDFVVVK